jgi:hypothetical protein
VSRPPQEAGETAAAARLTEVSDRCLDLLTAIITEGDTRLSEARNISAMMDSLTRAFDPDSLAALLIAACRRIGLS